MKGQSVVIDMGVDLVDEGAFTGSDVGGYYWGGSCVH